MELLSAIEKLSNRFFLSVILTTSNPEKFFKSQPMGRNTFVRLVRDACVQENIEGEGSKQLSTRHGL